MIPSKYLRNLSKSPLFCPFIKNNFAEKNIKFVLNFEKPLNNSLPFKLCKRTFYSQPSNSSFSSFKRFSYLGMGLGVAYLTWTNSKSLFFTNKILAKEEKVEVPFHKPIRRIRSLTDNSKLKFTLYQYQSCPFCCKVRAYLDFKGFSYDVIEVNSVTQKEIKWSKYKKVPILVCKTEEGDEVTLNDSSVIISCLETFFQDKEIKLEESLNFYPRIETTNKKGKKITEFGNKYSIMYGDKRNPPQDYQEVEKWREWVDNVFVHTISPNIYRTPKEAYNTFCVFSKTGEWEKVFSWYERGIIIGIGSIVMFFVSKILKKKYKLEENVRLNLYQASEDWLENIKNKKNKKNKFIFHGGNKPDLADLALYGVISAMEKTGAFNDMMLSNKNMIIWYEKVKSEIKEKAGKIIDDNEVEVGENKKNINVL